MDSKKRMFTLEQVSALCRVGYRTVARWVRRKLLPSRPTPSGALEVSQHELLIFLQEECLGIPYALSMNPVRKAMIVEDNLPMAHAIERTLVQVGFETKVHGGGLDVCAAILEFKPDLITLDLRMNEFDGVSVLKALRNLHESRSARVLVISGADDIEIMQALSEGGHGFLRKPFRPSGLKDVVEELFLAS